MSLCPPRAPWPALASPHGVSLVSPTASPQPVAPSPTPGSLHTRGSRGPRALPLSNGLPSVPLSPTRVAPRHGQERPPSASLLYIGRSAGLFMHVQCTSLPRREGQTFSGVGTTLWGKTSQREGHNPCRTGVGSLGSGVTPGSGQWSLWGWCRRKPAGGVTLQPPEIHHVLLTCWAQVALERRPVRAVSPGPSSGALDTLRVIHRCRFSPVLLKNKNHDPATMIEPCRNPAREAAATTTTEATATPMSPGPPKTPLAPSLLLSHGEQV